MGYNAENRLEKIIITGMRTAYYQYDANGQRVRKTVTDTSSNTTEIRKYVGEWEVYSKLAGSSLNIERETLHISDNTGRIALIDTRTQGTGAEPSQLLRYQYSNHLGSATLELDYAGAIISYEEYYPYGSTSFQSGRTGAEVSLKRYRYCAAERDEENGFYYFGARYYIPWLARWAASDPINSENYNLGKGYGLQKNKERDFLELTASPYEYCYDNPVRFNDTEGEQAPPSMYSGVDNMRLYVPDRSYELMTLRPVPEPKSKPRQVIAFTPSRVDKLNVVHHPLIKSKEEIQREQIIANASSAPQTVISARKEENAYERAQRRNAEFQVKMLQASQDNPMIGAFSFAASDIVGTAESGYNSYSNYRQGNYFAGTAYAGLTLLSIEGYGGGLSKSARVIGEFKWSSRNLSIAESELNTGKTTIWVNSQNEAEELFLRRYQSFGYRNSEGLNSTGARDYFGQKEGFYHWDTEFETIELDNGTTKEWLKQHAPNNPHGANPHLQIEPTKGDRIYIFWPKN